MELNDCAALLRQNDNFLLVTHKRPDGDTIGSAAALCHALRRMGKTAYLYPNPQITETYLVYAKDYLAPADFTAEHNICVDTGDIGMLAQDFHGDIWMKLDHHQPRDEMGKYSLVWTHAAACAELILALIHELCGEIDTEEANLLYVGLSTDTGCFCYANVTPATFRAAAELLEHGADQQRINKILFRTKRKERLLLESEVFSSLKSYKNDAINVAIVTMEMLRRANVVEDDCDDLASLAGLVKGNRVSVTVREICENPPHSKVSLRTDGSVDASALCAEFHGGGHKMAAGCEMDLTPEETAEAILAALEKVWP